jgi:hypothetical protein
MGIGEIPDKILVTDSKIGIGNPMTLVASSNLGIKLVLSSASISNRISQACTIVV